MSQLQETSDDPFGSIDEQVAQTAERLIAVFEDELEAAREEGERTHLIGLLAGACEAELLVSEHGPIPGAPAGLVERASRLVSQVIASIDEASSR